MALHHHWPTSSLPQCVLNHAMWNRSPYADADVQYWHPYIHTFTTTPQVFAEEPIEWSRNGDFQDVSMRLIGERILPRSLEGSTYLQVKFRGQLKWALFCPVPRHTFLDGSHFTPLIRNTQVNAPAG